MITRRLFSRLAAALPAAAAIPAAGIESCREGADAVDPSRAADNSNPPGDCRTQSGALGHGDGHIRLVHRGRPLLMLVNVELIDVEALFPPDPGYTFFDDLDVLVIPVAGFDQPPLQIFDLSAAPSIDEGKLEALISKAIAVPGLAAERERCARVAERIHAQLEGEDLTDTGNMGKVVWASDRMMCRRVADEIRALEPATPVTQAEDAGLMALAADMARKHGACDFRVEIAPGGELVVRLLLVGGRDQALRRTDLG